MSPRCSLVVNGKTVRVATGDTPLDAALPRNVAAGRDGMIQDSGLQEVLPRLRNTSRARPASARASPPGRALPRPPSRSCAPPSAPARCSPPPRSQAR